MGGSKEPARKLKTERDSRRRGLSVHQQDKVEQIKLRSIHWPSLCSLTPLTMLLPKELPINRDRMLLSTNRQVLDSKMADASEFLQMLNLWPLANKRTPIWERLNLDLKRQELLVQRWPPPTKSEILLWITRSPSEEISLPRLLKWTTVCKCPFQI